jgi:putative flavoprotein involved in K+ transport
MDEERDTERFETVIIGGGHAGLAVGRQLVRRGLSSVILDASERVGDVWRTRWDSLRLFTPARYDGLPGLPFPAPRYSFPTKDEMADYLEAYADHFQLPVRNGVTVEGLRREGDRHVLCVGGRWLEADRVVVATGACHSPRIPAFAGQLDHGIVQLHSQDYRRPSQLRGAACWWWAPATPEPRSPWRPPGSTAPGLRAGTPVTSRSATGGRRPGSCSPWCACWAAGC